MEDTDWKAQEAFAERVEQWFELAQDEFLEFDRIPEADRRHPATKFCGMLYLSELMTNPAEFSMHAEHDVLHLANFDELKPTVTKDDVVYLHRCGIRAGEYGLETFT